SDRRVANVGEMADGDPIRDHGLLELHEVADLAVAPDPAAGSQLGERTHARTVADFALRQDGIVDRHARPDTTIGDPGVRADLTLIPDLRLPREERQRMNGRIRRDPDRGVDIGGRWVDDRYSGGHQGAEDALANNRRRGGQLRAVVNT